MKRDDRIRREREHFGLRPWEFSPSEVEDGPSPYSPGSAGTPSWEWARRLRAQIRERQPDYFDDDQ